MLLRVQYPNYDYDYVHASTLNKLIVNRQIRKFLRPSENYWVDIEKGPVREKDAIIYIYMGPERRGLAPAN